MITAVEQTGIRILFNLGDRTVASYVLDDPFKPHFESLRTPAGHETTLVSPGDHRHHKGLMYALRCEDLNFWEEKPGNGCGIQEILSTEVNAEKDGLVQKLLWRAQDGKLETYLEQRNIRLHHNPDKQAVVITWQSVRTALRAHRLVKSEWSFEKPDGRRINYHGLGYRLPWMWRFPLKEFGEVEMDGRAVEAVEACGTTGPSVGFWGLIDGQWERTAAAVTMRQPADQTFTWFVLKADFPYLSLGPSNSEELPVENGQAFDETYVVEIADRPDKSIYKRLQS